MEDLGLRALYRRLYRRVAGIDVHGEMVHAGRVYPALPGTPPADGTVPRDAAQESMLNTPTPTKPEPQQDQRPVTDETAVPDRTPRTAEELLDESLVETFPASDPISPGAGVSPDPTQRP